MNLFNKIKIESEVAMLLGTLAALLSIAALIVGVGAYQAHCAAELDAAAIKAGYIQVQNVGATGYHWEPRR